VWPANAPRSILNTFKVATGDSFTEEGLEQVRCYSCLHVSLADEHTYLGPVWRKSGMLSTLRYQALLQMMDGEIKLPGIKSSMTGIAQRGVAIQNDLASEPIYRLSERSQLAENVTLNMEAQK
jgi:hypothetical protein